MKKFLLCLSTVAILASCNRTTEEWVTITAKEGDTIYNAMMDEFEIPDNFTHITHQKRVETCVDQSEATKTYTFDGVSMLYSKKLNFLKISQLLPLDWTPGTPPDYTIHTDYHYVRCKNDEEGNDVWGIWFLKDNHAGPRTATFREYATKEAAFGMMDTYVYSFFRLYYMRDYAYSGTLVEQIIRRSKSDPSYKAEIELSKLSNDDRSLRMIYNYEVPEMSEFAQEWGFIATKADVYREWRNGLPYYKISSYQGMDYDRIQSKDWQFTEDLELNYDYSTEVTLTDEGDIKAFNDPEGWAAERQ